MKIIIYVSSILIKTNNRKKTGNFAKDIEQLNAGLNRQAEKKGVNNGTQF